MELDGFHLKPNKMVIGVFFRVLKEKYKIEYNE